tara:strand:+ start:197 stop:754 length:558 start_codon:yes stop_codon:yes gene_type:complete
MNLTEEQLKQIIDEEIAQAIEEGVLDRIRARLSGAGQTGAGLARRARGMAQYARTGEAPSTAGEIGGAYTGGKVVKILNLHKAKFDKAIGKSLPKLAAKLQATLKDFQNDVKKLGIADDPGVQAAVKELNAIVKYMGRNPVAAATRRLDKIGAAAAEPEAAAPAAAATPAPPRSRTAAARASGKA